MTTPRYRLRDGEQASPPDYARLAASLSDRELAAEIHAGRGDSGYQEALRAEQERRKP